MKQLTSQRLILFSIQCLSLLVPAILAPVMAQDLDNVTISGRVTDQNGAAIPDATVSAVFLKTGVSRSVSTDREGRYHLIQLPPGSYGLRAESSGFGPRERQNLRTAGGQSTQCDFTLSPQDVIVDPVIVTSIETAAIDTRRTVVGGAIASHELEQLPLVTRSALDLIFALPGVTEEPLSSRNLAEDRDTNPATTPEEAGTFALSGGPAYSNNLTIDGLDNNDDRAARERFVPSLEAVEDVQVITNQFSAEYGRGSGGRINIRTRSGSSQFRGRAFYFVRDEALNANTFRNNLRGLSRLPLQEHDVGFIFGGPLVSNARENRSSFFVSYEFDKVVDSALIDTLVPVQQSSLFHLPSPTTLVGRRLENASAPALGSEIAPFIMAVNTPLQTTTFTARVDHQFNQTHDATLMYQLGRSVNLRQFRGSNRLADALQARTRNSEALSYSDTLVFSPQLVNQTRAQISRLAPAARARKAASPVVLIAINDPLEASDPASRSGTLVAGSSTSGATDRHEDRIQLQNILAYMHGEHALRIGFDTQRISSTFIDLSDATGTYNFASAGDFLAGLPSRFRQNFETRSRQRNTYLGFFAQMNGSCQTW